ncbi:MAG: glycosyltransferase family 2 protein [Comamonas sp.]
MSGIAVSIVSHGHGALIDSLLRRLSEIASPHVVKVIVTQNVPEAMPREPDAGWPFDLDVIRNLSPQGFGENHNKALNKATEAFFCVMNPDVILLEDDIFERLLDAARFADAGCVYPRQIDEEGKLQDIERDIPTLFSLLMRYARRRAETGRDWVNAAFLLLPAKVWRALGGFDVRYFMYCEDVDFCLRLRLLGWKLVAAPVTVGHAGQRASHRNAQHFFWHVGSLLRLWTSPVFWRAWWKKQRRLD